MIQMMDILHEDYIITGSNRRSDVGVNTYFCAVAHLKCMFDEMIIT